MGNSNAHSPGSNHVVGTRLEKGGLRILPDASEQRERDGVLNDRRAGKEREILAQDQVGQQEGVFGAQRGRLKEVLIDVQPAASGGKTCGVEVPDVPINLE